VKKIIAVGSAVAALALAGCGSGHSSGSESSGLKAASLAAKLGCKVAGTQHDQVAAHDTVQYANASGGPCSSETGIDSQGVIIITFASTGKEADWLRQNAAGQQASDPTGYPEVVSGHLWAIAPGGSGGFNTTAVLGKLGGKDTTF
jgi:hypothetical protein